MSDILQRLSFRLFFCAMWVAALISSPGRLAAANLKRETLKAFSQYVRTAELRMDRQLGSGGPFLWVDELGDAEKGPAYTNLRAGNILVHPFAAGLDLPGGMIYDWVGVVFIPRATIDEALSTIQNYNAYAQIYSPAIIRSKLLERNGDRFRVSLWLQKKTFETVFLHVIENVQYVQIDPLRAYSRSFSTRITEVEHPGTPEQFEDPPDTGDGYLWRLNDYRRVLQTSSGVYVQLEVIALTRNIPWGLEWLIKPLVTKLPRESLIFTLTHARSSIEAEAQNPRNNHQ